MGITKRVIRRNIQLHEKEAKKYEDSKVDIFNKREQERIDLVLEEVIDCVETDNFHLKALDIGCGTGNMMEKLSSICDETIGIDVSEDMLSIASLTFGEEEDSSLIRGVAGNIPFEDDTFDVVTAYSVFHHLPRFSGPISEISRILKPGGVLYIDHEPIQRENPIVKSYIQFCDLLNQNPSDGTEGLSREFCDYHIHQGNGGIPISRIIELCHKNDLEILSNEKYLAYSSRRTNPLYPVLKSLIKNEWLLIGRKKKALS